MKKLSQLLVAALMLAVVACGPSAEELKKAKEQDSVRKADSIAKIEAENKRKADSVAAVAAEQAKKDSIAKAEEEAKTKKGGKKK